MIAGVAKVVIQVRDQDRAKEFWTSLLGFEVVRDVPYGDERWLEVRSPDGAVNLVLDRRSEGPQNTNADREDLPTSNVMFYCNDLPRTHEELVRRGIEFPQSPVRQPFGWWSMFADREGNRFALMMR